MNKTEKMKDKIYSLVGNEFELLGEFINYKTKIKLKHNKCGTEFSVSPSSFIHQGTRCAVCNNRVKITEDMFKQRLYNKVENEYILVGYYKGYQKKVRLKHSCGYTWDTLPANFLNHKARCPKCAGNAKLTNEEFKQKVLDFKGQEYIFREQYKNSTTPILCEHNTCGYQWKITPGNFFGGKGCPKCSGSMKLTQDDFDEKVKKLFDNEYIFLEPYVNTMTSILCKHSCGHKWKVRPDNLFQGKRCPLCSNESKGEKFIREYLENKGISFETQKTFKDCVYINKLRFDFYLNDFDVLIEYDGEQHFKQINYTKDNSINKENFENTKKRDKIKNDYCKEKNIKLIRIPYTTKEKDIENIIMSIIESKK